MLSLDPLACRLLDQLDRDATATYSSLAKRLKVSSDTVLYQVAKLEREKVIQRYAPVINFAALGLILFRVSLQTGSEANIAKINRGLAKDPHVLLLAETRGTHDLILWGIATSINQIQEVQTVLHGLVGEAFKSSTVEVITETNAYSRGYLINRPGHIFPSRSKTEIVKLDLVELQILEQITENARKSAVEIAQKLDLTPAIVSYRREKLERSGIILGYRLHLDSEQIGIQRFRIQLEPQQPWSICGKLLEQFCSEKPNVTRYERQIGAWSIELGVEVESFKALHEVLDQLKALGKGAFSILGTDFFRRSVLAPTFFWSKLITDTPAQS